MRLSCSATGSASVTGSEFASWSARTTAIRFELATDSRTGMQSGLEIGSGWLFETVSGWRFAIDWASGSVMETGTG